jgi:ribosome-binding protein aMBF1 (putative translation factor)
MPNRASKVTAPREYTAAPETGRVTWPEGPFRADTPPAVFYAVEIAKRLRAAIDDSGQSVVSLAETLSLARSTIYDIINGETWADSYTLAALEAHLGVRLWPAHLPVR